MNGLEKIWYRVKKLCTIVLNTVIIYKSRDVVYYNKYSAKYFFRRYGQEYLGNVGCGPFCCAIVISTLLLERHDPVEMAAWSVKNGCYEYQHGTYHSMIPRVCQEMGLNCKDMGRDVDAMREQLQAGNAMAIVLCKKGRFARGGHFIPVGIKDGRLKVYNSAKVLDCYRTFEPEVIRESLAEKNVYIGPIWCVSIEGTAK